MLQVTDTLNGSVGIELYGDKMGFLVHSGDIIPCTGTKYYTNVEDNQSSAQITLRQGESGIVIIFIIISYSFYLLFQKQQV